MIDRKLLREQPDVVRKAVADRGLRIDVDALLAADEERRALLQVVEERRSVKKKASSAIASATPEEKKRLIAEMKAGDSEADVAAERLALLEEQVEKDILSLPNIPSEDTPVGPDESGNVVIRTVGEPPTFSFPVRDHIELGKILGVIDNERGAAVAGSRFTYLFGDLVRVQNALHQMVLALLTDHKALGKLIKKHKLDLPDTPFIPVAPPLMIRPDVFARMARLEPREERYHIPSDDLFLIGSAEHTLGPIHMDETLAAETLPRRYVAFTPAFRREAGTYGKDVKGILRLHQFDKIEMESFCTPSQSLAEQNLFVAIQEHVVQQLGIPYRVVQICTGDMGTPDYRQIDIECWMPGQNTYRETHTSDLMTDYQARRMGTKVALADGSTVFAHTNDATALAMGRILIALLENHQRVDGSVAVPKALHPYLAGTKVLTPRE